jgi:Trk-type K+ transport system membrane component
MVHRTGIYGFLAIYLIILVISYLGHLYTYQHSTTELSSLQLWLYSMSQVTFTHAYSGVIFTAQPTSFHLFSAIITLISSWLFHATLLWLVWRLFGNSSERSFTVARSLTTAGWVMLLCTLIVALFFLYAIPSDLSSGSFIKKMLAGCTLSINSFNNAGFSNWSYFFDENPLAGNFMIQVGVIGGTVLGSLGIYALIELFSPVKLRQRLANPAIDWSFLTKISLFGAAAFLIAYSVLHIVIGNAEVFANKNILESLSSILMQGVSARGFGWELTHQYGDIVSFLHAAFTFFGAGPISTGGGATLLFFVFLYRMIAPPYHISFQINVTFKIIKTWLILFIICLSVLSFISIIRVDDITFSDLFYLYTNHDLQITAGENVFSGILKSTAMVSGRLSFITACIIVINRFENASGTF